MALQSTVASIQNIRKQRQLELELVELDRKWHVELKVIARERLGLLKDLCRINQEIRQIDHFQDTMHGKDLTRFTDKAQDRQQQEKEAKETHKFSFKVDPVDKMNLQLPLIQEESSQPAEGGDIAQVVSSKDLLKHRVQLQKTNFEQCTADRRSRRRPFWDKAIIQARSQQIASQHRNSFYRQRRAEGLMGGKSLFLNQHAVNTDEGLPPRKPRALSKSPSLPALNKLRKSDTFKTVNAVHPSLSKRNSASLGYLPVIHMDKTHHGLFKAHKPGSLASSFSSVALPTIAEG